MYALVRKCVVLVQRVNEIPNRNKVLKRKVKALEMQLEVFLISKLIILVILIFFFLYHVVNKTSKFKEKVNNNHKVKAVSLEKIKDHEVY